MSRQRQNRGEYARVKVSESPGDSPDTRESYYAESHLLERFEEIPLGDGAYRWGASDWGGYITEYLGSACTAAKVKRQCKTSLFILNWLPSYDFAANLQLDVTAGITVGVVLVAQGVAYGLLAGLPAYYGLYASIPPAALYAVFGTSRQMHIGPFALVSLLVAEGVVEGTGLDPEADQDEYIGAVMTMSMMCGVAYIAMWACRLGFVVEILSDPTMSGMTTAAAFLICTSQMKHFLGLSGVPRASFFETWAVIMSKIPEINFLSLGIGIGSLAIQVGMKKVNQKLKLKIPIPEQLIVVVLMTWLVWQFDLENHGVTIFGDVETGLPSFKYPDTSHWHELVEGSAVVAAVSIALCIATAKTFAQKNGYGA